MYRECMSSHVRVIGREACADAEMDFACIANVASLLALALSVTAVNTIACDIRKFREMRGCWRRHTAMCACCTLSSPFLRQLLHEFMHERHSEGEVRFRWMIALPQSVGIEDADVDEPPYQASPALTALPAWRVGVVKL